MGPIAKTNPAVLTIPIPEWLVPFALGTERYKGAWGGRGSGKSHAFAILAVVKQVQNPNRNLVCVREVQRTLAQSVKRLIEDKIREFGVEDYFEIRQNEIRSALGTGVMIFHGLTDMTADNIKSLEGMDCVWIEEAQTITKVSLEKLRPTIRNSGSEIWASWNPDKDTDPIDVLLRGEPKLPGSLTREVNHMDNPWFTDALRMEMEFDRKYDVEKYLHVWEGKYRKHAEAAVFKNYRVEEFVRPKGAIFRLGADFDNGGVDPTVLVRCFVDGRTLYIDREAYQVGCSIDNTPALFMTIPDAEKYPIFADSARKDRIKHLRDHGFPMVYGAVKGPGSIDAGIEWLLNHEIIIHPRCQHTIQEFKLFSHPVDKVTGRVLPGYEDKHNHLMDALRYAIEELRRAVKRDVPSNVISIPIVQHWNNGTFGRMRHG